jgi:hypothetical protein
MTTPYSEPNSSCGLSTAPSRTLLQQLLEEINGASSTRTALNGSSPPSPVSTYSRSSSQNHSPSVWVGGSTLARDARCKLRAADEARRRKVAANAIDGVPNLHTPGLCLVTSRVDIHDTTLHDEHGRGAHIGSQRTPDPVRYPHDHMQHMLKGSSLSPDAGLSPRMHGPGDNLLRLQSPPLEDTIPPPLSPLIFSDFHFDDSSSLSPQTESTISPIDAPTSAATVYTTEELRTPTGNDGESLTTD